MNTPLLVPKPHQEGTDAVREWIQAWYQAGKRGEVIDEPELNALVEETCRQLRRLFAFRES